MYDSKAVNPLMFEADDSFTKDLASVVLSAHRISTSAAGGCEEEVSETGDRSTSDISKTKANLVGKFEAEALL